MLWKYSRRKSKLGLKDKRRLPGRSKNIYNRYRDLKQMLPELKEVWYGKIRVWQGKDGGD